ncbi:MAG: DUF3617 domain-containing protein [Terracidiphilus sp.]|jgi:hypothetical protein
MRLRSKSLAVSAGILVLGLLAWAQGGRKPGLWEITTTMTWQQSPFPQGMQMPPQAAAAFGGAPHTTPYCLTQAMIDRFGAALPQSRGSCVVANLQKTADSMSADWICTGAMSGKGSLESHFSEDGTARGKVHFVGTMQMGQNSTPVEWTSVSTSVYKGPDCGSVQPPPMPKEQ